MTTIRAEEVRIPRRAREAVARRGRPLREALGLLADAAPPDPGFAEDLEAILGEIGPSPEDPWAPS